MKIIFSLKHFAVTKMIQKMSMRMKVTKMKRKKRTKMKTKMKWKGKEWMRIPTMTTVIL